MQTKLKTNHISFKHWECNKVDEFKKQIREEAEEHIATAFEESETLLPIFYKGLNSDGYGNGKPPDDASTIYVTFQLGQWADADTTIVKISFRELVDDLISEFNGRETGMECCIKPLYKELKNITAKMEKLVRENKYVK